MRKVSLFGSTKASSNDTNVDPGTILEIDGTGMTVSTDEGSVKVKRVRVGRGPKSPTHESGLSVGDRFS